MLDWLAGNWPELLGFATGAACVLLAARRNILTFPIGIANNVVFIALFSGAALYADAALQVVYIGLGIMGWIVWHRGRAIDDRAATEHVPARAIPWLLGAVVVGTAGIALLLAGFTDSSTEIADAGTTTGSLVAQYMLNRRWIESWFVWIAVDVAYVGLYAVKGLWITAALSVLFIAMCVLGYRTWRRAPHEVVPRGREAVAA